MPDVQNFDNALDVCESQFERDLMGRLLERSYRVRGQVGSIGYRIDMVVEGADRRRLAVECDGDRFHGPQQWRQDMRRQRVLERVGWRFWRCFASSYYRDPDGVLNDLLETLTRMGIEPLAKGETSRPRGMFTEHRIIEPAAAVSEVAGIEPSAFEVGNADMPTLSVAGVALGDRVVLLFSDDQKRLSARLSEGANDLENGRLSVGSPLGRAILGADEGDEVELLFENGQRKVLIESLEKSSPRAGTHPTIADSDDAAAAVA
jgi:very-short-patch-repair endonuclease